MKLMCIVFFILSSAANAKIYISVNEAIPIANGYNISWKVTNWTAEDDDAPYGPTGRGIMDVCVIANRMTSTGCLTIDSVHTTPTLSSVKYSLTASNGEVRNAFLSHFSIGTTFITSVPSNITDKTCITLGGVNNSRGGIGSAPASVCALAPPPIGACEFTTPNLRLDFGTIEPGSTNGLSKTGVINVTCNQPMTIVPILTTGTADIPLSGAGNNIRASISINGKVGGGNSVSIPANSSIPLSVKADLMGNAVAGDFFGSAVALIILP